MNPIHSEGNARCLVTLILNTRLDNFNNFSKKVDPKQDLKMCINDNRKNREKLDGQPRLNY